ncbi:MAG: hypothetical protein D6677_13855 [Calditrichaeota bacterium]|nr:MAG: hypothetical protein D6677_13855 [Calditrichota bacterium]
MTLYACDIYSGGEKSIAEPDKSVCTLLSDSLFDVISSVEPATVNSAWADTSLADIAGALIDSLTADSLFLEQGKNDRAYKVKMAADTSYLAIKITGGKMIYFSTNQYTWHIYDDKLNTFTVENDVMPGATVAGCTELDSDEKVQPVIRIREEYTIPEGVYLLELITNDQTAGTTFRVAIH